MKHPPVTIIVTVYNVESVLGNVLQSIVSQTYPMREILIIDNQSTDRSVAVAKKFMKLYKRIPMRIILRKRTYGLSDSYNLGARLAKTDYIVTLHSDGMLPTRYELAKLMEPFGEDTGEYVAAMPLVVHRKKEWQQYNFWQKCLFSRVVDSERNSLSGKFDAYRRSVFLSIGGYDTQHFSHFIGSEDADMHFRLVAQGKIAKTSARVVHAHEREPSYGLGDLIARRRYLAVSYSRQLQLHAQDMGLFALTLFFVKPVLIMVSVVALWNWVFILPLVLFPFVYMHRMFTDKLSYRDPRIILLPFIVIYLVFAESAWMVYSLVFNRS